MVNSAKKEQIKEFLDKDHEVMGKYYDILDKEPAEKKLYEEMQKLIQKDPDFYDPYLIAADILKNKRKTKEARELLYTAYERALRRIVDKEGNFPKRLEWGWLENRHLIRAISAWADELWEQVKTEDALTIYKKLLHSNPNDNIGARYDILAIHLGLGIDYEEKFAVKCTPGYLSVSELSEWFHKHCKKFPDEFGWWFKAVKYDH